MNELNFTCIETIKQTDQMDHKQCADARIITLVVNSHFFVIISFQHRLIKLAKII